jgi:hypothetical protein
MLKNESPNKPTAALIESIAHVFRDPHNPNNVDLKTLREYVNRSSFEDNHIFKRKLGWFNKYSTINKQDFTQHFLPDLAIVHCRRLSVTTSAWCSRNWTARVPPK